MAAGAEAERNRAGMSEPMAKTALPGGPRVRPSLEGVRFEAGQPLARLDEDELRAQRQLAAATLEAAEARLSELVTGPLPEELARAKAQVDEAAAVLRLAERTLVRDEELAREGIVS